MSWIEFDDEDSQPFTVDTKYGPLVLAFDIALGGAELFDSYHLACADALREGVLKRAIIRVSWQYDVVTICLNALPKELRMRTTVVVQGTVEFERVVQAIHDGWIQAE